MGEACSGVVVRAMARGGRALELALVLAMLLAALGLDPAGAAAVGPADYPLCTADGEQVEPAAHGDRVVWVDRRSDPLGDIWLYDFATGEESQITNDAYEQSDPDLWGDWVVFYDYRNGNGDIYAKNLVTGEEIGVCTDLASQQRPKICHDVIVWEDYRGGQWDVYFYRVSTGEESVIPGGTYRVDRSPDVYRNTKDEYIIAWEGDGDLIMYNLSTLESTIRKSGIYGATLVAGDDEIVCGSLEDREFSGTQRLYLYRLAWGEAGWSEIATSFTPHAEFRSLSVSGDKVAYAYEADDGFRVRVHDWGSATEVPVTSVASDQYNPVIAGDMVVWRDDRNFTGSGSDCYDLYTNRQVVTAQPADAAITITSASATLARYGASYALAGSLGSEGAPLAGKSVVLQQATSATGAFADTTLSATTSATGAFSFTVVPQSRTWYRAVFAGDQSYEACESEARSALPRAWVAKPIAPKTMRKGKAATVKGYLKPRHAAGTWPVRIYKYRYASGKWKSAGYVKAKAFDYSSYTRYATAVKLIVKGKWRLRAYHPADAGHAPSWSPGYAYVTVK